MALNRETQAWIAALCGLSAEDFAARVSSDEEVGIERPQGEFFTQEELTTRDTNKYISGKDAGVEMAVKAAKTKLNYSFDGKDIDSLLNHHENIMKEKYGGSDDNKIISLQNDLKTQKETYDREIEDLKQKNSDVESRYRETEVSNRLMMNMPEETTIKPEAIITLFKNAYKVGTDENGNETISFNGEVMKDEKTAQPLKLKDVFSTFVIDEGYVADSDGRGGGSSRSNKKSSFSNIEKPEEFERAWRAKNPDLSTGSPQFDADYAEWKDSLEKA